MGERGGQTLGEYIGDLCEERGLSMRAASMRAGLAPETVSKILRRGPTTRPRADTLLAIAEAIGGDYARMLELAGYMQDGAEAVLRDAVLRRKIERLAQVFDALPLEMRYRMADEMIIQAEAVRAMYEAAVEEAAKEA